MPRKKCRRPESGSRDRAGRRVTAALDDALVAELEGALDGLLEEGIENYDDQSETGRRRMMELNAGFAAGEALLARRVGTAAAPPPEQRVAALCSVIRYILHWAGEARTLDEPRETVDAMRRARRALERASSAARSADTARRRRRGGAA